MSGDEDLLRRARHRIARAMLAAATEIDPRLGTVTLRPHQCAAVARLMEIIASHGGALLADAVGLGKTYVALAVAREYAQRLVICPSALRPMWTAAIEATGVQGRVVSTDALSRGNLPADRADLIIVDEAHHFRTPRTRRYEALAALARQAKLLFLSATPLHNTRRDLTGLLALFAGSGVSEWDEAALARLIVRRDETTAEQVLPEVRGPHALSPGADDDCLDSILGLPPTIPAADEGVAHALNTIALLHLWSSSRAALLASVRKRLARATALRDAVTAGHLPTAVELSAWRFADDALQLALPFFSPGAEPPPDGAALANQLDRFIHSARLLIERCRGSPDPDVARAALLRTLRAKHAGSRIVAFSQYARTIAVLGRLLRGDPGIALVSAGGASIASGAVPREEVLVQFAGGAPEPAPIERIDLLLTTDLLSEGIDLRGAAVIVHLDLPWNPARMEQRVGRARRIGSPFVAIDVYIFAPPAAAERVLELERRLRAKIRAARIVVGGVGDPLGAGQQCDESQVFTWERVRSRLRAWLAVSVPRPDEATMLVAAASAPHDGWVAVVTLAADTRMIADLGAGVVGDAADCLQAIESIGAPMIVDERRRDDAIRSARHWIAAREASAGVGAESPATRAMLERIARVVAGSPRHRRSAAVFAAQRARMMLRGERGVGSERALATIARSSSDDAAWLESLGALAGIHSSDRDEARKDREPIIALILLVSAAGDATPG